MSHRDGYIDDLPSGPGDVPGVAVRFDAVCAAFRHHLAVIDTTGEETYAALNERSARLATVLGRMGLERGERCAIMVPRSRDTLALILAILRVGAVYVPLDPAYPRAQLDFIVADCSPKLIIAEAAALASVGDLNGVVVDLAEIVASSVAADPAPLQASGGGDAAYIMYTSGSTGKPKGVVVPHRAILRLVRGQSFTDLSPKTRFLNLAPLAFDASTLEIWGPLLNGGCAAIINEVQPSLDTVASEIARLGVTSAWFTACLFNALADYRLEALFRSKKSSRAEMCCRLSMFARSWKPMPDCRSSTATARPRTRPSPAATAFRATAKPWRMATPFLSATPSRARPSTSWTTSLFLSARGKSVSSSWAVTALRSATSIVPN